MNRRAFVGTGLAVVGAGVLGAADLGGQGRGRRPQASGDKILDEIGRQFDTVTREARNPRPGTWQRGSSAFTMLAAWAETNDIDGRFQRAIRQRGRGNLAFQMSQHRFDLDLKAVGVTLPVPVGTVAEFENAIDTLTARGVADAFREAAHVLELAEREGKGRIGLARVGQQVPSEELARVCARYHEQLMLAQATMVFFCIINAFLCGIMGAQTIAAQLYAYYAFGCA
jgi:hypothetical protein